MSAKSQHNNILLAIIAFILVVVIVGLIGFLTLGREDDTIQGEVVNFQAESSNYALRKETSFM